MNDLHPRRDGDRLLELQLDPSLRLCPQFDEVSIARFPVADRGEMGVRVLDNCCEVHIM